MRVSRLSWFEERMLLPGESLLHEDPVRLHTAAPPYRWDGVLVLTSERLFFLPHVSNPTIGHLAFWVAGVRESPCGCDAFAVRAADGTFARFEATASPFSLTRKPARVDRWLRAIAHARRAARRRETLAHAG